MEDPLIPETSKTSQTSQTSLTSQKSLMSPKSQNDITLNGVSLDASLDKSFTSQNSFFSSLEDQKLDSTNMFSKLDKIHQSWLDPFEAKVSDIFYSSTDVLRPEFDSVLDDKNDSSFKDSRVSLTSLKIIDDEENVNKNQLGTWDGVMAQCLLNIFGVIMFLRLGWIVGQAGIMGCIGIIILSSIVTLLTTLSMSAIATNGIIKGGGAYYLISRSLGPEIGGSVGVLFAFGNMGAVSLYLIGFAETLVTNLDDYYITGNMGMDIRMWAIFLLFVVMALALGGLKYVVKVQLFLLAFILFSILCVFIGSFYQTHTITKKQFDNKDWKYYSHVCDEAKTDFDSSNSYKYLYATKGWTDGNIGSNKYPKFQKVNGIQYDFFKTLAIFFPAVTGIMAGANISGDLKNPSENIPKGTLSAIGFSTVVYIILTVVVGAVSTRCGLLNNYLIMADITVFNYLVLIGVYAATLSSAIASLVGAPRILQRIAQDDIINVLSKFKRLNYGYWLTFVVAGLFNLMGNINLIAPLITDFFMISYFMINISCFALAIGGTPGWRPSWRWFNRYSAFTGALLCLIIMFLMDYIYAVAGLVITFLIYYYIHIKDTSHINWGSAGDSILYYNAYKSLLKLKKTKTHVRNWRPGFLGLIKDPVKQPHLILFLKTLDRSYAPIIFGTIHMDSNLSKYKQFNKKHNGYLPNFNHFYQNIICNNFRNGSQILMQTSGLGNIKPNTLVIDLINIKYLHDNNNNEFIKHYFCMLIDALIMGYGIMICCNFKKIIWNSTNYIRPPPPNHGIDDIMDVWMLVDDGGLLLLIPHLLKRNHYWRPLKLRANVIIDNYDNFNEFNTIQNLIKKFRLKYVEPRKIPLLKQSPSKDTIEYFEKLAKTKISQAYRPNIINKWLRVSELIIEYSKNSALCVIALPRPYKNESPNVYMALLHTIARDQIMPPCIIMRGNGENTLTFYSE